MPIERFFEIAKDTQIRTAMYWGGFVFLCNIKTLFNIDIVYNNIGFQIMIKRLKMDILAISETKEMIVDFLNTLQKFPSKHDFFDAKENTRNVIYQLYHNEKTPFHHSEVMLNMINKLEVLKYDSTYEQFVLIANQAKNIHDLMDYILQDIHSGM